MFVCVFAKKFPALASKSCCEVSRPRAVWEYEYHLLVLAREPASFWWENVITVVTVLRVFARML